MESATGGAASDFESTAAARPERVAIVVVHGVMPHPRYETQDQCAGDLADALNADSEWSAMGVAASHALLDDDDPQRLMPPWVYSVLEPLNPSGLRTGHPLPTMSRVRVRGDDPIETESNAFDVIEAYWSPLDKGKTTFARVSGWLLQTIFTPLNSTARLYATSDKTIYDFGLILAAIVLVIVCIAGALLITAINLAALANLSLPDAVSDVLDGKILSVFGLSKIARLALGAAGGYLIAQAVKAALGALGQASAHNRVPAQRDARVFVISFVLLAGLALLIPAFSALGARGLLFIVAGLAFEGGRTIAESFIVNFFGDIEIYTTRDENVDFNAMRESILDLVTSTIVHVSSDTANAGRGYDRVFVLAHSLGSTIALDALLRYQQLVEQSAPAERQNAMRLFHRIRAFVTFGSPLEKTKYFFDVSNPTPSLAMSQWRDDEYGPLFTKDVAELQLRNEEARAMFWGNYWYWADAVANELQSYRSFVPEGGNAADGHGLRQLLSDNRPTSGPVLGRNVCRNERGFKGWVFPAIIPHGEYLGDPWFWHTDVTTDHVGVLDIVARSSASNVRTAFAHHATLHQAGATYETTTADQARKFPDFAP